MARKKSQRFAELTTFPHYFDCTKEMNGHWREVYFHNNNPLILELGCGKGEYAVALGEKNPHQNVIGIDIQGERLWYGATAATKKQLANVAFLRAYIDHLPEYFEKNEVNELWITFPDPQPRGKYIRKRLTSPNFLTRYQLLLKPKGKLHLKTDNALFFEYSINAITAFGGTIQTQQTIHPEALAEDDVLRVQTMFEQKYRAQGIPILYCCFTLPIIDE
ncbi:MAG: tRNA (guanosine(46)-N7)-methyltransferase TrmB [Candidatus Magasanikbacteria bacterium]|uniref:tRNA (guanine-N(7)-)-methyltransferase n=1 Tax=Candidatus Magasanikbacteria bacterium CG10_big_fil_rev_8_21_14_0_10_38_6 TaxID=1974647 RepID=A0A2M6P111_9BACT|nr:tRNA (guanosine(46)-N7)-methyltransferase TrmB [Candidatus Magasanikbacteria bacterium]PIR77423.1 MAG: tRNA (guanosine(46)-N7)-methyltransferase TrmB [Candidatus Magasanikbacteria bacterium CG10_big_fil_rev_8_21_14_0_10_38_6]